MLDKGLKILMMPEINLIKMSEIPEQREDAPRAGEAPYADEARFGDILLAALRDAAARECGFDREEGPVEAEKPAFEQGDN